jgi:HEAT repeat protein
MTFLGEFKDERAVRAMIPFLEDHDEGIRFMTVEALFKQKDELAREPLLHLMIKEDEESLRIKHRIAEGFFEEGWQVKGFRGTVEKLLASQMPEFIVDGKGHIKLKKGRKEQ